MKQKMTRQQRRKMERDMKKKKNNMSVESLPTVYSWTVTDLETMRKYKTGHSVINGGLKNHFENKYSQNKVYQTTVLVDFEEKGMVSPGIVQIVHDSESDTIPTLNPDDLVMMVLTQTLYSGKVNKISISKDTKVSCTVGYSSHLNYPLFERPQQYMSELIRTDCKTLMEMVSEFKKVG